ncbi:ABC transporter, substrate-binding protein (cluster 3, basic aa/glutamine/opines) [Burkholderia anthina]|nr:ABC transporter, substrate-binding protein (cluster 3, basic aa/glutamine/opines) [Burkholderia anthina]
MLVPENDFDGMIPALKAKKFDAVRSSVSITPRRAQQIGFMTKIYNPPTRLVVKKGSSLLPTAESLKGKSTGVEQGTTQETYAKAYWGKHGANVVSYQNQDGVYADLIAGRLDAALRRLKKRRRARTDTAFPSRASDRPSPSTGWQRRRVVRRCIECLSSCIARSTMRRPSFG